MLKIVDASGELVAVLKDDNSSPELTLEGKKKKKKKVEETPEGDS